jgi:hypothetical protein
MMHMHITIPDFVSINFIHWVMLCITKPNALHVTHQRNRRLLVARSARKLHISNFGSVDSVHFEPSISAHIAACATCRSGTRASALAGKVLLGADSLLEIRTPMNAHPNCEAALQSLSPSPEVRRRWVRTGKEAL